MASRELLKALAGRFESLHGQPTELEAAGGVEVAKRIRGGAPADVVVLARNAIDSLAIDGAVHSATVTDIAQSGIAVAVRALAEMPDISDEAAVKRAVLAASTISYSTGPSGVYLEKRFEEWGVLSKIRDRIVVPPPGTPVGSLIAAGKVELGFQQFSELMGIDGLTVVGPLPPLMQLITTFSGAVASVSSQAAAAKRLLGYLASAETASIKAGFGMEAVGAGEAPAEK
jgi:molybdate transport system substrate-binding protein